MLSMLNSPLAVRYEDRPEHPLAPLIAARATDEGVTRAAFSGMCFYRVTSPVRFKKVAMDVPRLIVVAQGRKVARFEGGDLAYDEDHFLVVTAETTLEGQVLVASPERPYLAMCMDLSPEVVARTLLALADADPDRRRHERQCCRGRCRRSCQSSTRP